MNVLAVRVFSAQGVAWARGKEEECAIRRRRALRKIDRELEKRNYKAALSVVKQLQGKPGGLRGFGTVTLVPRRMSSTEELEPSKVDIAIPIARASQRSLLDSVLHSVKCCRQFALEEEEEEVSSSRMDNSMDSETYDCPSQDHHMCLQHEAGHFLVGYLLGVLPKRYRVPSLEDLMQDKFAGGKVEFLGFEFLTEIGTAVTSNKNRTKRKPSNETINRFLCVILGGLVAEHLLFGYSELLHSDVKKLDSVLKWLGLTEDEADFRVRSAALNTILMLYQYHYARSKLAEVMATRRSIGICIDTVENALDNA